MRLHLNDSEERRHFLVVKSPQPSLKIQLLYTGVFSTSHKSGVLPHDHNFFEIMLVRSDEGLIHIDGQEYKVKNGDIVIYYPKEQHCEEMTGENPLETLFFAFRTTDSFKETLKNYGLPHIVPTGFQSMEMNSLFQFLISESQNQEAGFANDVSLHIGAAIIYKFLQISSDCSSAKDHQPQDETFSKIKDFLDENYQKNLELDYIAKKIFISKFYLCRLFKEYTGLTPSEYMIEKRISLAKQLLQTTELSIEDISQEVGYDDKYYFSRLFKKEVGVSVMQYRRRNSFVAGQLPKD
ncbi:MAG: AraC family transcriptional regulator [Bacilli bacterium]|jgi:AraC-like DNA-binding protein/ASC-1-like (ASCH) protein|nr:AraC family transcriptional regulator [Bacilli bacterium]